MTGRRRFIARAGGLAAAAAATAIVDAPSVIAQPKVQWRMSTGFTAAFDIHQGAALWLARAVDEMTGGRFRIQVFPGGLRGQDRGLYSFSSVLERQGARDRVVRHHPVRDELRGHGGLVLPGGRAQGDGLKLMEEAYGVFNLVPRPATAVAPQMAGWFRKKINAIGDLKGLRMRIVNLGGKVCARAGATTVLTPGNEIYAALERGVIDASEWTGPHDDVKLGLHRTARYCYYPGWHEPGTTLDFGFNRKAHEALPIDLRRTLDHAAAAVPVYGLTEFHTKNAIALERLRTEFKGKVEVLQLPAPVLRDLRKLSADIVREESEKTPMARKVHASFAKFQALVGSWDGVAEGAYHRLVAG